MSSMSEPAPPKVPPRDRGFYWLNGAVSVGALGVIAWLLIVRQAPGGAGIDLRFMPGVNAGLNTLSTLLLVGGFVAARRRRFDVHRTLMVGAFIASSLFLVGYLAYHYVHGDTKFAGEGVARAVYLTILASHVLLSMGVVPLALSALYFAWRRRFVAHRKVTRILLPMWLYVSVTGVIIYLMLHGS